MANTRQYKNKDEQDDDDATISSDIPKGCLV